LYAGIVQQLIPHALDFGEIKLVGEHLINRPQRYILSLLSRLGTALIKTGA